MGRTVVKSARLPSTRQYTRAAELGLWFGCSKWFSSRDLGAVPLAAEVEAYCKQSRQKDEEKGHGLVTPTGRLTASPAVRGRHARLAPQPEACAPARLSRYRNADFM